MTDTELLDAYRATHDRQVLDGLFARHYPTVYHVVLKLVRNGSDASDLTQSTFLKALESAESVRSTGSLRNWLLTIAINEVRQFRRGAARRNRPEALGELARKGSLEPPRDADLLRREFEEQLELALQQFPDELKDPLVLHYYQNLSYAETAQILGIPKSSVQFRMEQAIEKLRGQFKKRELLALIPVFFPRKRFGSILGWGATIMNVKGLATSAVVLCMLFVAGGMIRRATAPSRPETTSDPARLAAPKVAAGTTAGNAGRPAEASEIGIFGKVVDRVRGTPIAGATITAFDFENATTDRTVSDEKGLFRLASADRSARTYHLIIARPGYASLTVRSVAAAATPLHFALGRGGAITGRVVDSDGAAVFPYRVAAIRSLREKGIPYDMHAVLYRLGLPKDWVPEEAETVYSPDGSFEIRNLNPGPYALLFTMDNAVPFCHPPDHYPSDDVVEVQEGESVDIRAVRPAMGFVRIRAIDRETRQAIPGAQVSLLVHFDRCKMPGSEKPVVTDAQGCCDVRVQLQYGDVHLVLLQVSKPGYAPKELSFSGQPNGFEFDAELARPAGIRGSVRDRNGTLMERVGVYVERNVDGSVVGLAFTDAEGRYALTGLDAPERYVVYVFDRRLSNARFTSPLMLREGEIRELNFGASSGATISGNVTLKGKSKERAAICVDGPGASNRLICYVNNEGEYQIEGLGPGSYELDVDLPSPAGEWVRISRRITLVDGERRRENFDLGGLMIRGTTRDAATLAPVAGQDVEIVARRVDGVAAADRFTTRPGADGRFELVVSRPGIYQLTTDNQYGSDFWDVNTPQVDLTESASADDVQLLLRRDLRDGKIILNFVDAATGAPIPGGWYQMKVGTCGGAGTFDGAIVTEDEARIGTHKFIVGADEYVPVQLDVDITWTKRRAEASVNLVKSETVRIKEVLPSSPAEKAGLQAGDLLVSYDGAALRNLGTLKAAASGTPFSQKVALEIRRGDESRVLVVPGQELGIKVENALLR